ncbi:hypothetical protein F5887DRAFT_1240087 [Amanita rubescens]|nr:hypothetical protein F5887DRAFT_1240087 [Amanita rubescens]
MNYYEPACTGVNQRESQCTSVPKQRAKAISGRDGEDELVREIGRAGREWSKSMTVPKQRAKAISGRDGEDELVREIGRAGREWSKRFWRKEDMTVYLWRLISEIARLSGEKDGRDDLDVS